MRRTEIRTDDFESGVRNSIESSIAVKQLLLGSGEVVSTIAKISEALVGALDRGNKTFLFGNGDSAADAQHIAAEFVGRFEFTECALCYIGGRKKWIANDRIDWSGRRKA